MRRIHMTGPYTLETWGRDPAQIAIALVIVCGLLLVTIGASVGWYFGARHAFRVILAGM